MTRWYALAYDLKDQPVLGTVVTGMDEDDALMNADFKISCMVPNYVDKIKRLTVREMEDDEA